MDKLEVGMYVRTKDGFIDEVIIEYHGYCNNPNCKRKHVSCKYNYYDEENIVKASHNIIDLIEVGDYVNGYNVAGKETLGQELFVYIVKDRYGTYFKNSDIKSIVTKEQFESMKYRIGD